MQTENKSLRSGNHNKLLRRRYRAEQRFKWLGVSAIAIALAFLAFLFITIIGNGYTAFKQTFIQVEVHLDKKYFTNPDLSKADYGGIIKASLRTMFPDVSSRGDKKMLYDLVSKGAAFKVMDMVEADPKLISTRFKVWVPANDDVDMLMKGYYRHQRARK